MLKEAKRLWDLGFAIHWLKPKSKVPVEAKWTTGKRKTWDELKASYREGYNIGVRLGEASKLENGYLYVIDCDVKSANPNHLLEMENSIAFLNAFVAPIVTSGRGNGSKHIYFVSPEPMQSREYAKSKDLVTVIMPSAGKPSKREIELFTKEQLAEGRRLRPAWEISIMGEGRQVVLPPSVHPDSGKSYVWSKPIKDAYDCQLLVFEDPKPQNTIDVAVEAAPKNAAEGFQPTDIDYMDSRFREYIVDMILKGENVEDKSSAILVVATDMLKAGFSDNEVISVLTDKDTYLGSVAYEHAKTNSRIRAAKWVARYTLYPAKKTTQGEYLFAKEVTTESLTPEQAEKQREELLVEDRHWTSLIERTADKNDPRPKQTIKNLVLILQNAVAYNVFTKDEFANSEIYGVDTPWKGAKGKEITDGDIIQIKMWLAENYRMEPASDKINEAVSIIASRNKFHPVKDYLETLEWDGKPRIDTWLKLYTKAQAPEPYLSAVSRKTLVGAIARIYEPGCKFDYMLILQGGQGEGKSTTIRALCEPWFSDSFLDISSKDAVLAMRAIWIMEMGELSGMSKADVNSLKEFASRQDDRIRAPYGKRTESFPRQCIFIGTTNNKEYFKDPTGNRRFWPVSVGSCDFSKLRKIRDQLWAEAKFAYQMGEPLYLETKEMQEAAKAEQEERTVHDPMVEQLQDFFESPHENFNVERFRLHDLFAPFGALMNMRSDGVTLHRVTAALRKLGYDNRLVKENGKPVRVWRKIQ